VRGKRAKTRDNDHSPNHPQRKGVHIRKRKREIGQRGPKGVDKLLECLRERVRERPMKENKDCYGRERSGEGGKLWVDSLS